VIFFLDFGSCHPFMTKRALNKCILLKKEKIGAKFNKAVGAG
jgi:hypothetical protein